MIKLNVGTRIYNLFSAFMISFENPFSKKSERPEFEAVGGASEDEKKIVKEEKKELLEDHYEGLDPEGREKLKEEELEKNKEETYLINLANEKVNELMEQAGVEPYDIPEENYHLLPGDHYKERSKGAGATYSPNQIIVLNADKLRGDKVSFFETVVHETFHLKGKYVMEVESVEGGMNVSSRREGLVMPSTQKKIEEGEPHRHFRGVSEAVTTEATLRVVHEEVENNPKFEEEKELLNSEKIQDLIEYLKENRGIREDDIITAYENGTVYHVGRKEIREALDYVCREVAKCRSDDYKNKEEVFGKFLRAQFSGELKDLARSVDETFGKGGFRILGNMKDDAESATMHLETLQKMRQEKVSNAEN